MRKSHQLSLTARGYGPLMAQLYSVGLDLVKTGK